MRSRPSFAALAAVSLVVSLGAAVGLTTTASADAADAHTDRAAARVATQALATAREAMQSKGRPHRDATLALRDLFRHKDALSATQRAEADSFLDRPWDPSDPAVMSQCGTYVCLHWTETGVHAATPEYAAETLATMDAVHGTYVEAGYRAPLPDENQGGTTQPDIYLSNIGPDGLYGYCTSDADAPVDGQAYYAFCVLDNDYAPEEFPSNTPIENMQVTGAHEYFHAVQFGYDAFEDSWIIEATATWAEDEVFDDVNDNLFYLQYGQLGDPRIPLDAYGFQSYGNWIFFRFLTEQYTAEEGTMPYFVLELWELMDSTTGAPNLYSTQALDEYLRAQGSSLRRQYGDFAALNNLAGLIYEEGAGSENEDAYPLPPYRFDPVTLSPANRKTKWRTVKLNHLTSATGAVSPGSKMTGQWRLKIKVKMASKSRGSEARVVVYYTDGGPVMETVKLNKRGRGSLRVPFDYDRVNGVEVTLANASHRMKCGKGDGTYSCSGQPLDDKQPASFRVMAKK